MEQNREGRKKYWWRYGEAAPSLYQTISELDRVIVVPLTSKFLCVVFTPPGWVYSHSCGVIALTDWADFACLQSTLHDAWARKHGSTLETRLRYTPADVFATFPFPKIANFKTIGESYYEHRRQIMLSRQEGLTTTYNRFHNPDERGADIVRLRELHVEMDQAVAGAYGWEDLALEHGFHQTAQGLRYTISESARREVLARLLRLNHERYEEEVKAGLHDRKVKDKSIMDKKDKLVKEEPGQYELF